jgi:hypothetical protein
MPKHGRFRHRSRGISDAGSPNWVAVITAVATVLRLAWDVWHQR